MTIYLDETAKILTQPGAASIYASAIRLFEFQIWVLSGGQLRKDARLFAAIKLLEYLEQRVRETTGEEVLSLRALASDPEYVEIFDTVIATSGGWRAIRGLWGAREFDDQIKIRWLETKTVANFIDFSYRFARLKTNDKRRGGITTARFVVRAAKSYDTLESRSTMKNRWNEYERTSGFLYLLHIQKFELKPARITKKSFIKKLLGQASDRDHLIEFFQAYKHLIEILNPRGYSLPTLSFDVGTPAVALPISKFPPDVEDAIKRMPKDERA